MVFFVIWERFLTCQNNLILHKRTQEYIRVVLIEFGEDIIDEKDHWKIKCSRDKMSLDYLESEQKHLHLATREIGFDGDRWYSILNKAKSPIIPMRTNMCMPCEDISFPICSQVFDNDLVIRFLITLISTI